MYLRIRLGLASAALALMVGAGACNRPETPPTPPVVPTRPMEPQAATPDPLPTPPPKDVPAAAPHDTPESPATAPSASPDKQAPQGALEATPATPGTAAAKKSKGVREIHPTPGNTGCLEMYGTCTPPPERLCTSSAFYLDCGAKGQLPSNGEWLHCVCP